MYVQQQESAFIYILSQDITFYVGVFFYIPLHHRILESESRGLLHEP
jgi:hypothetical protein